MKGKLQNTWIDKSGREVGKCLYCMRTGKAKSLKPLPKHLDKEQVGHYCPRCYPEVLEATRNLPWNRNKY